MVAPTGGDFRRHCCVGVHPGDHRSPLRKQPASLHGRSAYARASEMPIKFLRGRGTFFKKCPAGAFLPQGRFSPRKKTCFSRKRRISPAEHYALCPAGAAHSPYCRAALALNRRIYNLVTIFPPLPLDKAAGARYIKGKN